jgi:fatty acyl-CoA reductase
MLCGKDLIMVEEDEITSTPILDFYRNKVVMLTGGTGFLGKLLMQKLLRCESD